MGITNDNVQDKINKGREKYAKGEDLHHNKITQKQADEIRLRYNNEKITQEKLSHDYGISRVNISLIVNNINWKENVYKKHRIYDSRYKLTQEQVDEIRWRYTHEKITHQMLAQEYGVSRQNISSIINNKNRKIRKA